MTLIKVALSAAAATELRRQLAEHADKNGLILTTEDGEVAAVLLNPDQYLLMEESVRLTQNPDEFAELLEDSKRANDGEFGDSIRFEDAFPKS